MLIVAINLRPEASSPGLEPEDPGFPHEDWLCQINRQPLPLRRHEAEHLHYTLVG